MSDSDDISIEYELIRDASLATVIVLTTEIAPTPADEQHVRIEGRLGPVEDEDDEDEVPVNEVEHYAFPFVYVIGVLSFADARPRGASGMHFKEKDDWIVGDMLRHLRFEGESSTSTPTTCAVGASRRS
jgi:hypothetical protein